MNGRPRVHALACFPETALTLAGQKCMSPRESLTRKRELLHSDVRFRTHFGLRAAPASLPPTCVSRLEPEQDGRPALGRD